jgi:hypothetical protein
MIGYKGTFNYRVSFNDEAAKGLRAYDDVNTTLFEHNNAYAALNFAMALNGRNLKGCVVDLKRLSEKVPEEVPEDGSEKVKERLKISYELKLSHPLPRKVLQFAQTYLDVERTDL